MSDTKQKTINIVSSASIIANTLLFIGKLLAGLFGHSTALVSDAVHSASDIVSTVIVIIGTTVSNKEADADHEYGHERLECIASMILSILLLFTGMSIGIQGIKNIVFGDILIQHKPGVITIVAALVSIILKEIMYRVTVFYAKRIDSAALLADAWHHRSDAFSSIGSLIGIILARQGIIIVDFIVSIIICIFIVKVATEIFIDTTNQLVDNSCGQYTENQIKDTALSIQGVYGIDLIKTRKFGTKMYVDIEISADETLTLKEAHRIAEEVHDKIESKFSSVKHCMVHVNPVSL